MRQSFVARTLTALGLLLSFGAGGQTDGLEQIGQIRLDSPTEIICVDAPRRLAFATLADRPAVAVVSFAEPDEPSVVRTIGFDDLGASVQSAACHDGLVAAAISPEDVTEPGRVAFFRASGERVRVVEVGPLPDMVVFTPDGKRLVVANEGEPNAAGTVDPEGSVSIVELDGSFAVRTVALGGGRPVEDVSWFTMPGRLPASMIEPEYIAVSPDSRTAHVVCQENNAVLVIDLNRGEVIDRHWLGYVEWSEPPGGVDLDQDAPRIEPVHTGCIGLRQPDAIVCFPTSNGVRYVTANEGDPRDVWGVGGSHEIDGVEYALTGPGDGEPRVLFGSRGVTLWDEEMQLRWDSQSLFERALGVMDARGELEPFRQRAIKKRSDKRGIEPESLATGEVDGRRFVYVGLERAGMIAVMAYDAGEDALTLLELVPVLVPGESEKTASPEGLAFVPASDEGAPPLLLATDEVHGTLTVFSVDAQN